jgi:hypothetical protein
MRLTHLFACPCGSIISGQRLLSLSIIALSTLKLSLGSLAITHDRIRTGSPSVLSVVCYVAQCSCSAVIVGQGTAVCKLMQVLL